MTKYILVKNANWNETIMIAKKTTSNPYEQLKEAQEWCGNSEDIYRKEIMVDKDVYYKAVRISKILNTDIEGVFRLAAYRILKNREVCSGNSPIE